METEITLPDIVPAMTLPGVAFFPQALMPLRIFEPRYRHMLADVLATNRLFAVASLDLDHIPANDTAETPFHVASVGIIRACQKNDDGTSNLLLQGICRVEIMGIVTDQPYRRIKVRALASQPGGSAHDNEALRLDLLRLLSLKKKFAAEAVGEMAEFLKTVDDPDAFIDIAAFSLCDNLMLKQTLLETLSVRRRLELLRNSLRAEIADLRLRRKLQGPLTDDRISDN